MSELLAIEKSVLVGIADAIRAGTKKTSPIPVRDLAAGVDEVADIDLAPIRNLISRNIVEIEIPERTEEIGDYAFYGCGRLERVVMPSSLESIAERAFSGCSACLEYDFTKCEAVPYFDETAFEGMNENVKIYVPSEKYNSWIKTARWYSYRDHIEAVGGSIPELEESEGLAYTYNGTGYTLTGLGSCEDVIILVPATYDDGVNGEAAVTTVTNFSGKDIIKEIVFKSTVDVEQYAFNDSPLVRVENIRVVNGSAFSQAKSLRYARFAEGAVLKAFAFDITGEQPVGTIYDFRDCVTVANLQRRDGINDYGDTHIVVPDALYDQWIEATNWTYYIADIIRLSDAIAQGIVE